MFIRQQTAAAGAAIVRLKINATIGGTPNYAPVSGTTVNNGTTITGGNSIASYDVAGTSVTGGQYLWSMALDNPGNQVFDLVPYEFFIAPGETGTFSMFSTNTSVGAVAANWSEDI